MHLPPSPRPPPLPPLLALLIALIGCAGHGPRVEVPRPPLPVVRVAPVPGAPTHASAVVAAPAARAETVAELAPLAVEGPSWGEADPGPPREAYPDGYADKWERRALGYWGGSQGDLAGPLARAVDARWPGVPRSLFVAFVASAGRGDNTAARTRLGLANARFHEIGWFGVEAGPVFLGPTAADCSRWWSRRAGRAGAEGGPSCVWGPTPSPDPTLPYSRWAATARDARVRLLLGHDATVAPGAWVDAIADQVAVGLTSLGDHGDDVNGRLPEGVRARDARGPWFWFLAFAGWSTGDNGARLHILRHRAALAREPESRRVGALVRAVALDALCADRDWRPGSHSNPAFSVLRTLQKRALAARIARRLGDDPAFFLGDAPAERWAVEALVRAAYGRLPRAPGGRARCRGSLPRCPSACPSSPRPPSPRRSPPSARRPSSG